MRSEVTFNVCQAAKQMMMDLYMFWYWPREFISALKVR